ncbi:uncharacterized protein [Rutidosis leptorrhynchoides]|uniref:uncharacterized protein n=1 Tax=Rutidosis leptorrhynchoides TaxID=125765 RepID=UPI003A98F9F2
MSGMKVCVVGAGVSGLVSAYLISKAGVKVVLYDHIGSQPQTFTVNGVNLDLSLMAVNRVTCPNIMDLFETLEVDMKISDMSFSVSLDEGNGYEWGNRNGLSSLFAQKTNVVNPFFLMILRELTKFKDDALRYLMELEHNNDIGQNDTLWDFITSHEYSELFQKSYLFPICTSFWMCNAEDVMRLSAYSVLLFFRNYHLFQVHCFMNIQSL